MHKAKAMKANYPINSKRALRFFCLLLACTFAQSSTEYQLPVLLCIIISIPMSYNYYYYGKSQDMQSLLSLMCYILVFDLEGTWKDMH